MLLFAWGLEPKRTEEFVGRLPYGSSYILKALAKLKLDALQLELRIPLETRVWLVTATPKCP